MVLLDNKKIQTFLLGVAIIIASKLSKIIGPLLGTIGWIFIAWSTISQHNLSIKLNLKTIITILAILLIIVPDHIKTPDWCVKYCKIVRVIGWVALAFVISLKGNSIIPSLDNFSKSKTFLSLIALILVLIKLLSSISNCSKDIILINILWLFAIANGIPSTASSSASVALSSI